jgi:RNA polymerase sigma-70 factor (ECF subfamily)
MKDACGDAARHEGDGAGHERGLRSAVLAGDEQAWRALYEECFNGLWAYVAWRCVGSRSLTEEVVQETWFIAVRRIRSFDPEQGSFATWLRGIAANVLRNQLRQLKRCRVQSLAGEGIELPAPVNRDSERIATALAALSDRHEAVLRAKYLEQQNVDCIAQAWKETPKAIESLLTRARSAFREAYLRLE